MKVSVFGIVWLCITIFACCKKNIKSLIYVLLFSTVFQAQYVLAFGNNAINAMTITSIAFIIRAFIFDHKNIVFNSWSKYAIIFVFFVLISSIILPLVFKGISFITISNDDFDFNRFGIAQVSFDLGNLTQAFSLILYAIVAILIFNYRELFTSEEIFSLIQKIFILVFVIGCIHLLLEKYNILMPFFRILVHNESDLLGSDMLDINGIFGFAKFMSTFYEASYCGAYLSITFFVFLLHEFKYKNLLLVLCLIAILFNFSTTGIATFLCGIIFVFVEQVWNKRLNLKFVSIVIVILLLLLVLYIINPNILVPIKDLTLNKTSSGSFNLRTQVDQIAIQVFSMSHGLGIGMNQIQTYSLIPALLAQTGVIGFILYVMFYLKTIFFAKKSIHAYTVSNIISLLIVLVSQLMSISPLNFCVFWYCIWIVMITHISIERNEKVDNGAV